MRPATRLRAAVVGAGSVGRIHARAFRSHARVDLVAVCGRTAPKTEALASEMDITPYLSVDDMLDAASPDVVSVCTGNAEHFAPTIAALDAGAHVFVEKPLAFRLDDARAMVQIARGRGLHLGVNFNHRFSGPYRRALEFVERGAIGSPCYLSMKFSGDLYKELNDPFCQLIETQGHSFDLLRLFGGEIVEVAAFLSDPRGIGVFTSAAVSMSFSSGAVGTLLGSWDASYKHPSAQVLELSGTDGRVVVDNVVDSVRLFRHDRGEFTQWEPELFESRDRDFWQTIDAHVEAFIDSVLDDRDPPVSGEDGVKALETTFAAIRSFQQRRVVRLGEAI